MPALFAFDDPVAHENYIRIVEYAGRCLKVQTGMLRPVHAILLGIPFEAHRYTYCITIRLIAKSAPSYARADEDSERSRTLRANLPACDFIWLN